MPITYKQINPELLDLIVTQYIDIDPRHAKNFENIVREHIHLEDGSYSVVALHDGKPVGFISTYTKNLTPPLESKQDAYIDIIEVATQSRHQGIARTLITMTETWAKENGFTQIRSWSSKDKSEAISMWYSLGFAMCPAEIWIEWCKEVVEGYYVAKTLRQKNR